MPARTDVALQGASGALVGAVAPLIGGPETILWVMAAMGMCSLGDVMAPPADGRWRLAVRYLASVAVTLSASYTASAWVAIEWPEWHEHMMAVRIGSALVAGLLLHPIVALAPRMLADVWAALLTRVRGSAARE